MTETVQRIVLASRPVGEPTLDNFRLEELPIPQPGPGQMLLRTPHRPMSAIGVTNIAAARCTCNKSRTVHFRLASHSSKDHSKNTEVEPRDIHLSCTSCER